MKQLNLIQPPIAKAQPRLYLVIMVFIVSCLCAGYFVTSQAQQSRQTKQQIGQVRLQISQAEQATTNLTSSLQSRQSLTELRQQEARLVAEQASLTGLNNALRSINSNSRRGFADDLQRLAQSAMPGLWLQTVELGYQGNQKNVRLQGISQQSEALNTYIQRLERMQLGTQINVLNLTSQADRYMFNLASTQETPE